jgi:excisionase family DNA binding protein
VSNVFAFPLVEEQAAASTDPLYGLGHRMLTLEQICDWFNVTERHVRKLVERDAIPYRKVGRLLRFYEPDVDAWTRPTPRPVSLPASPVSRPHPASRPRKTGNQRISMSSLYQ